MCASGRDGDTQYAKHDALETPETSNIEHRPSRSMVASGSQEPSQTLHGPLLAFMDDL
jgi:hypothetical protein